MRSLTLAKALTTMGAHCCFWPTPHVVALLDRFAPEMAVSEAGPAISAIVFDHYGLTAADHRPISQGRPTLVVDDLANRPLAADLVVDVGPLRREAEYQPWVGSGTRLLLGPHFAPVRPDFVNLRSASLARRGKAEEAQTALVAMGLTDVGGHSADIVEALLTQTRLDITVVLGREAPSSRGPHSPCGHRATAHGPCRCSSHRRPHNQGRHCVRCGRVIDLGAVRPGRSIVAGDLGRQSAASGDGVGDGRRRAHRRRQGPGLWRNLDGRDRPIGEPARSSGPA